ncbi:esterase [Paramesorhizobium deserti]|uniref:Esterase n=1 Tax=Paramesorhizobium deserti TaxID=1494590 RepID=A0A135HVL2_9HYPH|nr:alpha/beta hydrolase [Paramesorhizobium deserti]KXF77245.1 esterase [Paramesorhizobium deserti]
MIDVSQTNSPAAKTVYKLSESDRRREAVLLQQFADFWGASTGEPRTIYDKFISASPLTDNVKLEMVDAQGVRGWWVRPLTSASSQAILYIHGGGYVMGSAMAYRGFVSQIVNRTGVPALVIDYPLAPEASLPAAPEAALRAWDYLAESGYNRIAVVGDSAGGGLSLVTLSQLARQPRGPAPIAGVVFSPWADLAFSGKSMTDPAVTDALIGYEYLQDCASKYVGSYDPTDPLASPLYDDLKRLPPLLIQVGTEERLLDDSRQLASRAAKAGVKVQLEIWEGMHHVFQLDVVHLESSRMALDHAANFLRASFEA